MEAFSFNSLHHSPAIFDVAINEPNHSVGRPPNFCRKGNRFDGMPTHPYSWWHQLKGLRQKQSSWTGTAIAFKPVPTQPLERTETKMPTRKRRTSGTAVLVGISALVASLAAGCAHFRSPPPPPIKDVTGRSCLEPEELIEVLSRFSVAVQKHEYHNAISMLVPEDQARMIGATGTVPEDIKVKLNALDFKALSTDRRIDLVRGRLKGVFDCLPCLDQGEATVVAKEAPAPSD
jgi:hypothetical protein